MSQDWKDLLAISQGKLTREQFLVAHPDLANDYASTLRAGVAHAEAGRDADMLAYYLTLAAVFGAEPLGTDLLARLLTEDWHRSHEDLAWHLQRRRDPRTVDVLWRTARYVPAYLAWDDNRALAVKCLWALKDIGTVEARQALRDLVSDADPIVSETAAELLDTLGEPIAANPDVVV